MAKVRFGPAGVPIQCDGSSTLDGVKCCAELQLDAMEMEFVQGVRLSEESALEIAAVAKHLDISLSSHAPYFINFCSREASKIELSTRNLLQAARITHAAGGRITVFHPGFYQKQKPEDAYAAAKKHLAEAHEKIVAEGAAAVILGAETVGKKSAFGGLEENVRLSQELGFVQPVLDFAHIHARGDVRLKTEDDYMKIFSLLEQRLGDYVQHFHAHFSEVSYSDKGEQYHLPLGAKNEPPLQPLLKVLAENGYGGTIICETPKIDIDAQLMKEKYMQLVKKYGR